jgi:hypothetical protein
MGADNPVVKMPLSTSDILWIIFAFFIVFFGLVLAYYRKRIMVLVTEGYAGYKEQKKFDDLYARLDRNKEGKFSQKEHLKALQAQKKATMKKNREQQQDVKGK